MKITSTPQNQHFTGCFVIKDTGATYERLQRQLLPTFNIVAPKIPVIAIKPDNIFNSFLSNAVDKVAAKTGYGANWLVQNASRNGININMEPTNDIFIFSGKEFGEMWKFMHKKNSFKSKFVNFWNDLKEFKIYRNFPPHLREIGFVNKHVNIAKDQFYNFTAQQNCKKVDSLSELMFHLTNEM